MMRALPVLVAVVVLGCAAPSSRQSSRDDDVTRTTLGNGLQVVIVRDPLAPVVTIEENYLVGANETPAGLPGTAHAQEHMAFRGCDGVSGDQTAAIYAQLGGAGNADTQQTVTQYFTTVPVADLDVALRLDAACMRGIDDSQAEWVKERGAIEQEVARDLSEPTYRFITRLNNDLFAGTPYAHDALGTHASFEATTGDVLKAFYRSWYAPNNAILVIAGNVDPGATLARVRDFYGSIPRRSLPPRPDFALPRVTPETFTLDSNLPYTLAFVAYRLPGTNSPDYAAARILADVLTSQRGNLYALVPGGKALEASFDLAETYPKASVGLAEAALPAGIDPAPLVASMADIVAAYVQSGLPTELVDAAKRAEIASAAFRRNSIPDLAATWSQALAVEHRTSPDDLVAALRAVTVADVNRIASQYLVPGNSIAATLIPSKSGEAVAAKGFGGGEQLTSAPARPVALPPWAETALSTLTLPEPTTTWTDTTLPNGLRLIVRTERASPTITVLGSVRHEPRLQAPAGKEGIDDVLGELFSYGTTSLDRLAFQQALDDIAASETAGYDFSLRVQSGDFARGVALLAENVLHPALPAAAFETVRRQTAEYVAGDRASPEYRTDRALLTGLLPAGDPGLREATPQTISTLTLADVQRYHQTTFRPDLTTIVVIGDVTPDEAATTISGAFGAWQAMGPTPVVDLPKVPAQAAKLLSVPDSGAVQATVTLAQEIGITRFDADYYALQLGNHVLGGGFYATRLYRDLRQDTGYVYTVDNSLTATRTRSVFTVSYGADPHNVTNASDLIRRDLRAMQTDNVTPAELHQAKALLLRQIPLRESSEDSIAGGLLARAQIGLPLDEAVRGARLYFSLTADQVRAAFARWIRPDGFVEVVRGPADQEPSRIRR